MIGSLKRAAQNCSRIFITCLCPLLNLQYTIDYRGI